MTIEQMILYSIAMIDIAYKLHPETSVYTFKRHLCDMYYPCYTSYVNEGQVVFMTSLIL